MINKIIVILFFFSFSISIHADITLFAAASTTDLVKQQVAAFEKQHKVKVKLNIASSGKLARQIESGAAADLYISASRHWINYLLEKKLLKVESITPFLSNSIVIIAPKNSKLQSFTPSNEFNLPEYFKGRISMGDPRHVPAGKYALEALQYFNWDGALTKRILPTPDTRAALVVVEMGEVELGMVFKTDALKSQKVKILAELPIQTHSSILYFAARPNDSSESAKLLLQWLNDEKRVSQYKQLGFSKVGQ